MKKKTLREEREEAEFFAALFGVFHFYLMRTFIVPIFFIYLILDYGWTDDVKMIIAIPMFFYIPFLLVYLTNNKKEKAKFKKSVDEFLLTWIGIILAFCFVYFIFQF
tara:strand:+ start:252 stop:572 length:321 start_codon:yes stop_codon:yes gene_type:complete